MKKLKTVYYVLMFLPLPITVLALAFLPDTIPAHYGVGGTVDRWGSKYETLIFPAMTLIFGVILLLLARYTAKKEQNGENNPQAVLITGIWTLALMNALTFFFLYLDVTATEDLSQAPVDVSQLVFGLLGVGMLIMGNIMPKLRLNSVIGLRTPWSMKHETGWTMGQHFGGIAFMVSGLIILVISCAADGVTCLIWSMAVLGAVTVLSLVYSYRAAKA